MTASSSSSQATWSAALLVFLVPMLLPFGRAAELPMLTGALVGVYALLRHGRELLTLAPARVLTGALGAYFLAAVLSSVDAVAPAKSWTTSLAAVRLLLYGLGLLWLCSLAAGRRAPANVGAAMAAIGADVRPANSRTYAPEADSWMNPDRLLALAAALPIAFWTLDALVQIATGHSLGGNLDADRLSGIFGADDLKLGPLLPALAPLLLWPLLRFSRTLLIAVYLLMLLVVLLAGARAGWISFGWVSLMLAWRLAHGSKRKLAVWALSALLAATIAGALAYQFSPSFQARVERTLRAGEGDADFALAGRVPIWGTALRMARAHPVNGVGVRGFRHAYPDYAAPGDPWVDVEKHTGAAHAHQIVLELLTETGAIGLALWLGAAGVLWRLARRTAIRATARAPWAALAVLTFPLNTHLAFYSSFLGIVLGWLLALACAQSLLHPAEAGDAP